MAAPPWREPQRYLRNSPLFQVEHVTTPVLLIQGDLDAVPIEQNEQYISALHRLGKRGRFVRYWGEGHLLRSPANIRDMWQRILAWMDEFHGDPAAIGVPPD
jgi:dipeptidyl aminopeptidase/acylaminoacyl peptidase